VGGRLEAEEGVVWSRKPPGQSRTCRRPGWSRTMKPLQAAMAVKVKGETKSQTVT